MNRMRHLLVSLLTALLAALAFPVSGSAQTLEELYARLDPLPETEAEFAAISRAIEDLKLEHRFAFCAQKAIPEAASCSDMKAAAPVTTNGWSDAWRCTPISSLKPNAGGS